MTIDSGTFVVPSIRLSHRLGEGGMGEVWVADHLTLDRRVAVKVIRGFDSEGNARERFEREAKAAARIQNPHVVQVFDYGVTGEGLPFITMELLEGEDLAQRIGRGPLSPQELAPILVQTASALASAHEHGVVHRDIKPPNIFLVTTPTGEPFVKVLDFGIAMTAAPDAGPQMPGTPPPSSGAQPALTSTGAILGTPNYMSPEQLLTTENVTHQTDIWSLGVVAYEALAGMRAFDGQTFVALCMSICEARYDRSRIPEHLRPWFDRALAIDPVHRFSSVMEAAEAFRALAVGSVGATAVSPVSPGSSAVSSTAVPDVKGMSRGMIVGLAATACVLGAVIVVAMSGGLSVTPSKSAATSSDETSTPSKKKKSKKKKKKKKATSNDASSADTAEVPPPAPDVTPEPTVAPSAEVAPSSPMPAPVPRPPSAPLVSSKCKVSCRDVGACGESGGTCVVRSSADCRQSYQCTQWGKCTKTGSVCGATSGGDCAASGRCKSLGHCGLVGNACAPTQDAHCRQAPRCKSQGQCAAAGGTCIPGSDADCKASARCASSGDCYKNGMVCRPKR